MKSRTAKGCFVVVLLLAIGGGFLYWRATTPPRVAENFRELSPEEKQRRRENARRLEEEVQGVARDIRRGDKKPFQIVASEEQLNTLLQDRINTDKFPIRDLRAGLADGKLTLQGTVPYKGLETTATLSGNVSAQNGKVVYRIDSLLMGGLFQAPEKWKRKVEKEVGSQLNKLLEGQDIDMTRAAVENKQLVLEGTPR